MTSVAASFALAGASALLLDSTLGISRDISQLRSDSAFGARLGAHIGKLGSHVSLYHLLELADPIADALWFEGKTWSYAAMLSEVDILAVGLQSLGVKNNDFVAVFMTNTPEFVFTVYALSKLGAAPAMINSMLRGTYSS